MCPQVWLHSYKYVPSVVLRDLTHPEGHSVCGLLSFLAGPSHQDTNSSSWRAGLLFSLGSLFPRTWPYYLWGGRGILLWVDIFAFESHCWFARVAHKLALERGARICLLSPGNFTVVQRLPGALTSLPHSLLRYMLFSVQFQKLGIPTATCVAWTFVALSHM